MPQDGIVRGETFDKLFRNTNIKYYTIQYTGVASNFGLDSTDNKHQQKIINGVAQKISSTKLKKTGYNHVGWIATSTIGRYSYVVGCLTKDCSKGAKGQIYTSYDAKNGVYKNDSISQIIYPYVYSIGDRVSQTGWVSGQIVKFNAKYCASGYAFNKKTSKCEKSSTQSSSKAQSIVNSARKMYNHTLDKGGYYYNPAGFSDGVSGMWDANYMCCASYVSWVLYDAKILTSKQLEYYTGVSNVTDAMKNSGKFTSKYYSSVDLKSLKAGDIVAWSGHIQIYAGGNKWYNGGSTGGGNACKYYEWHPNGSCTVYRLK